MAAADGGVFNFGDAEFFDSTGNESPAAPVVCMAVTPSGKGYWLVAGGGGIFYFGDAGCYQGMATGHVHPLPQGGVERGEAAPPHAQSKANSP